MSPSRWASPDDAGLPLDDHTAGPQAGPISDFMKGFTVTRVNRLLLPAAGLTLALLAGCTTYTFPDGSRETLWGVPAEDETKTREERQAEPIEYRVPGEIPE